MQQSERKYSELMSGMPAEGWLSEQPIEFQKRIAMAGRWTTVPRGGTVYMTGDVPNAFYGLGQGLLDISIPIGGHEEVSIHRAKPGFWIGDSALLAEEKRSLTVSAPVESRVFRVPISGVRRILAEHPGDWACFLRLNHANATLAVSVLAEVLSLSPRARFARMLLRLASPDGSVRATQDELGRLAGMSRAAFRRACMDLIEAGTVHMEYGGLRVVDPSALERATKDE